MKMRMNRTGSSALALGIVVFGIIGCMAEYKGEPVNYGPEVPVNKVLTALREPAATSDPTQTKIGAYVHFMTYQIVSSAHYSHIVSDTGHTVVDKTESGNDVTFSLVEKKQTYLSGGKVEKLAREFSLTFEKPTPTPTPSPVAPTSLAAPTRGALDLSSLPWSKPVASTLAQLATAVGSGGETYHRLETSTIQAPPPEAVRQQPNCLGIPGCEITYHSVSFDQVYWSKTGSERIEWGFVFSPDVPQISGYNMSPLFNFYPGLMQSCVTLMVPIGEGGLKRLLKECQQVVNFRFEETTLR